MSTNTMMGKYVTATKDATGNVVGLSAGEELNLQVGGIVKASRRTWPGYYTKQPFQPSQVFVPFGTALIDTKFSTGATMSHTSADSTLLWNNQPSSKVTITVGGSTATMTFGTSATPSLTLNAEGQAILSRRFIVPIRATGNTISSLQMNLYAPDTSNRYAWTLTKVGEQDGWELWAFRDTSPTTTLGSPNLTNPTRAFVSVGFAANVAVGTLSVGQIYAMPLPAKSVVITLDDGTVSWPWIAAEATKRGLPISFGVTGVNMDIGAGLTTAEILDLAYGHDGLHEVTNHGANHDSYATAGLAQHMINMETQRAALAAMGLPEHPLLFHAYPSGSYDAALITAVKAAGYLSCRTIAQATPGGRCALNAIIAADGSDSQSLYDIMGATSLQDTTNFGAAKTQITSSATNGTAFIIAHKFEAAAAASTWIKGYDSAGDSGFGILDLFDWLATQRDENGWIIRKWSDWYDDQLDTVASIPL